MWNELLRLVSALAMIGLAVGLMIWLQKRLPSKWRIATLGILSFFVSQVVHDPLNETVVLPLLTHLNIGMESQGWKLALFCASLGLSAGLCEELTRYLAYCCAFRANNNNNNNKERTYQTAMMLGAGHGGCEAILIGFSALWICVWMVHMRHADLDQWFTPEDAEDLRQQMKDYWELPWVVFMLEPVERIFAMTSHLSLSIMVWQVFSCCCHERNYLWLIAAILYHTAMDGCFAFVYLTCGMLSAEAMLLFTFFPLSLFIIAHFKPRKVNAMDDEMEQLRASLTKRAVDVV